MHAIELIRPIYDHLEEAERIRAGTISPYDISIIAGLDNYNSPLKLWAERTGKLERPALSRQAWIAAQLRPLIVNLYRRENGQACIEPNAIYRHPEFTFATATPAALQMRDTLPVGTVQVTKCHGRSFSKWEDGVPLAHLMRSQWELGVLGLEVSDYAVLSSDDDFKVHQVEFDSGVWEQTLELAEEFLEKVSKDIPPNAGPGDKKLIDAMIGERAAQTIDLSDNLEECVKLKNRWYELKESRRLAAQIEKRDKNEQHGIECRFQQMIGAHQFGTFVDPGAGKPIQIKLTKVVVEPRMADGYEYSLFNLK